MTPRPAPRRPTPQEKARLAVMFATQYRAGAGIKAIAAASGWSYGFVHRALTGQGVTRRRRGRPAKKTPAKGSNR